MNPGPSKIIHIPALLEEVIHWLRPHPGGHYLDATVGLGGHAEEILKRSGPDGVLYGLDRDMEALRQAQSRLRGFGRRTRLIHGDFKDLEEIKKEQGIPELDGLLFDLGVSSLQLEVPERGFAFSHDGPLDMRMDQRQGLRAAELVNRLSERELADLLWKFGEERYARRIARRIVEFRKEGKISTTRQLAEIVQRAIPTRSGRPRIHPATRTFQALRIAINRELEGLERAIRVGVDLLRPGARVAVISYHSLEDRIVKQTLASLSDGPGGLLDSFGGGPAQERKLLVLSRRPITPQAAEIERNPRSRSAKLRVAERV